MPVFVLTKVHLIWTIILIFQEKCSSACAQIKLYDNASKYNLVRKIRFLDAVSASVELERIPLRSRP